MYVSPTQVIRDSINRSSPLVCIQKPYLKKNNSQRLLSRFPLNGSGCLCKGHLIHFWTLVIIVELVRFASSSYCAQSNSLFQYLYT